MVKNFNETLGRWDPLLVAFFDPRSQSFQELRRPIEDAAHALASRNEGRLGRFAAVDVTQHSFLSRLEAPELQTAWQQPESGESATESFRFGRPRFYPLIILLYSQGQRKEYQGVVKAKDILAFLRRAKEPVSLLQNRSELRRLQRRLPGPLAIGCENVTSFQAAAQTLRGEMTFATGSKDLCSDLSETNPPVLYLRGERVKELTSDQDLVHWLRLQRPQVLQEITPDNSWTFLERPSPLVIYLADGKGTAAQGEVLFASIEERLETKYYQLAWADCKEFGDQFEVTDCPAILVIDPDTDEKLAHLSLTDLERPKRKAKSKASTAERLYAWLQKTTAESRKRMDKESLAKASAAPAQGEIGWTEDWMRQVHKALEQRNMSAEDEGYELRDAKGQILDFKAMSGNDLPKDRFPVRLQFHTEVAEEADASGFWEDWALDLDDLSAAFASFHARLQHMVVLRESFQEAYGMAMDFSSIEKVQQLHPEMRLLASSTSDVAEVLRNATRRQELWTAMERRLRFVQGLERDRGRLLRSLKQGSKSLRRLFVSLHAAASGARTAQRGPAEPLEVPRVSAADLSLQDFIENYAKKGLPVIITGLNVSSDWTQLSYFRERCGHVPARLVRKAQSRTWGRLVPAGKMSLAEFVDTFNTTRRNWYLHDWSLPNNCPDVFGPAPFREFTVPKYFAGDYFQRAAFEGYQHTWPSLFIGSNETESALHIDSGNTNFMLHLLSGRKEWRFYARKDLINLYQSPTGSHFHFDVFRPDYDKFPLAGNAEQYRGIQEAGETIVIPAGNPHGVRNLEHIHGISMNYVDASNLELCLLQKIWQDDAESVELYTDGSIRFGLTKDQQALSFGQWKSQDWTSKTLDLFEAYGCHAATKSTSQAPVWGSNLFRSDSDSDPAGSTASDREPSFRAEVRARSSAPGVEIACVPKACNAGDSVSVTKGAFQSTITLSAGLAHTQTFITTCQSADEALRGELRLTCHYGTLQPDTSNCEIYCLPSRPGQAVLGGQLFSVAPPQEVLDGAGYFFPCADLYTGFAGQVQASCNGGALAPDVSSCSGLPCEAGNSSSVTLYDVTQTLTLSQDLGHDAFVSSDCASVNSDYSGTLKLRCFADAVSADTSGCTCQAQACSTAPCPATDTFFVELSGIQENRALGTQLASLQETTLSCESVVPGHDGSMTVLCSGGVLQANTASCAPRGCSSKTPSATAVVGGVVKEITASQETWCTETTSSPATAPAWLRATTALST
ncbi:unnamed protein product [Effrenium voratum]|uniref:JmjC domain-containing protein n=1 Tax=Effrenium voratum TaxID=2562239 RepID=A0AA36HUF9_9DINO|nr:unnamed protein product [Effrenium voratum]